MERKVRVIEPEALMEQLPEILLETDSVPLVISGNSMSPFLVHGRDTIYLSRLTRTVKKGDALLYRRDDGAYIFHRVYKVEKDSFTMVGDAQTELEPGIGPEQVIAIMASAMRKGKKQAPGCFWWEFFEKIWIRMVPLRPFVRNLYTAIGRMLKG